MIDMMSKYRVFCTVVELGSFTAAAERLNYSQSAVSQTIKTLEQELGTTLLSRQTHRLQLTRDGESYLPYLQEIAAADSRPFSVMAYRVSPSSGISSMCPVGTIS